MSYDNDDAVISGCKNDGGNNPEGKESLSSVKMHLNLSGCDSFFLRKNSSDFRCFRS